MAILRILTESQNGVPQDFLPQGGSTWSNWCAKVKKIQKKCANYMLGVGWKWQFSPHFLLWWADDWAHGPKTLLVEVWTYQGTCPSWKISIIWKQVTPIFLISGVKLSFRGPKKSKYVLFKISYLESALFEVNVLE